MCHVPIALGEIKIQVAHVFIHILFLTIEDNNLKTVCKKNPSTSKLPTVCALWKGMRAMDGKLD